MKTMKSRRPGGASGGGIRKRGPTRTDRDGDMEMDNSARGGRRGRGDSGRPSRAGGGRSSGGGRPQTRDRTLNAIQQAISENNNKGSAQANVRHGKGGKGNSTQISITGWKNSNASTKRDGGVENLISFCERKLNSAPKGSRFKVTKSRVEGDILVVSVHPEWTERLLQLNGKLFAGVNITVELYDSSTAVLGQQLATSGGASASTADTKLKITSILGKRFNPAAKLLDLSKLVDDTDLQAMGIFNSTTTQSKFFPAMMKVWEMQFTSSSERREAVESVSLAQNQLANVSVVTTMAQTFADIKNLDLSNNNFKDSQSMIAWRWKFRNLEFLDLTGNDFSSKPDFKATMLKWYPKLQTLNNVQVRTAEEIAAQKKTPIPIQAPHFQDDSQIAENFIRTFFASYDNNRNDLINQFYDENSKFSLNVNVQAPKVQQTETAGWDAYIKRSRNLSKITHLSARMNRIYTGPLKIGEMWNSLPQTRHPDMATQPEQFLVECHLVPGLPDPTGQSPTGVGGLIITVHGKFDESVDGKVETRSFDRSFIIGPGHGPGGIRVLNDILCARAYGGHEAWSPESQPIPQAMAPIPAIPANPAASIAPAAATALPGFPEGYGAPAPGKTETQVQQEQLVIQISTKSGMTLQYSEMALSGNGWNLDAAWKNFEELKAQGALPPTAFLNGG
ncbi:mRNA export factor mex67 [Penicillium waksmanii]|uniref:mRNA export factor mex67 n=1 Tax=Penicillium waksmanii TaxID=69791 RepID=UPI0025499155|nr:mRNA export factor mex67 [Penicillium waksmanii]KAJ6000469.1 mRNA export factor mex67 [Penicillium waksmanii]